MRHFKLTTNTKFSVLGTKLFQVELTIDCKFGKKGDLGGFIEKEENLRGDDAWLYKDANIEGDGVILGGVIRGGVIRGGVILGGVILGGESGAAKSSKPHFNFVFQNTSPLYASRDIYESAVRNLLLNIGKIILLKLGSQKITPIQRLRLTELL